MVEQITQPRIQPVIQPGNRIVDDGPDCRERPVGHPEDDQTFVSAGLRRKVFQICFTFVFFIPMDFGVFSPIEFEERLVKAFDRHFGGDLRSFNGDSIIFYFFDLVVVTVREPSPGLIARAFCKRRS
jgi:hypothetical protein